MDETVPYNSISTIELKYGDGLVLETNLQELPDPNTFYMIVLRELIRFIRVSGKWSVSDRVELKSTAKFTRARAVFTLSSGRLLVVHPSQVIFYTD